MIIASELELDELLSRPSAADIDWAKSFEGPLMLLGAGGKMGPTLARRAKRAAEEAGRDLRVIAVSRYSSAKARESLEHWGIETISADLRDREQLATLPEVPHIVYMAARKFGSTGSEYLTWAMNSYLPSIVAERYRYARIIAMSSGNVYPFVPVSSGGAVEQTPLAPVGEYGQSAMARERLWEYFSRRYGIPVVQVRLNYAVEMRYGVLVDIGQAVFERKPVNLTMGNANVIWQGDANSVILRSFALCSSPPAVINLTGPETISVRETALQFGRIFGVEPAFAGEEAPTALLNNAAKCHRLFGYPQVTPDQMIEWIAAWIGMGGTLHGKPTGFMVRDGKF